MHENYWNLGRWARIPVSMHWTVLLAFPWLFLVMRSFVVAAIGSVVFFLVLVAHEFGHVAVARARGVRVEEIKLFGAHGETSLGLNRTHVDDVLIAWGGVAAQALILVAVLLARGPLMTVQNSLAVPFVAALLEVCITWNIFVMIVALLPIGPMDGRTAWKALPLLRQAFRGGLRKSQAPKLSAAQERAIREASERAAAEIIGKLGKKAPSNKDQTRH